jgi:hypothetical protein
VTHYLPRLTCKNPDCSQPILLPLSIPRRTSEHRPAWPTIAWKRNFLCLSCKHAHPYTAQDVQWKTGETKATEDAPKMDVASIEVQCAPNNCLALLRVFVVMRADRAKIEIIRELMGEWTFSGVQCSAGHQVKRTPGGSAHKLTPHDLTWI